MFDKKKLLIIHFFMIYFGCFSLNKAQEAVQRPYMTIFIHGIIKTPWTIGDLIYIAQNNIFNTKYKFATEFLRKSHEYFLTQPMQSLGLKKIDLGCVYPTSASAAIASVYEQIENNPSDLYYTFGWSGFFSRYHRDLEAINLYNAICQEVSLLRKSNIDPKIRIVAFSHGGNVALNMAKYISSADLPFEIDRLSLLGTPIQLETDHLILHPIFKEVFNFYSDGDIAQMADFLTTQYGVSNRVFKERKTLLLPDKLKQIQMRTTKIVKDCKGRCIRIKIMDPNHLELWTFGWGKKIYRKKFPLNPLPMASLIPLIIKVINSMDCKLSNHVQANFIPANETLVIKDKKTKEKYPINISNTLECLQNCACKFKYEFSYEKHTRLMKDALNYAIEQKHKFRKELSKYSLKFG